MMRSGEERRTGAIGCFAVVGLLSGFLSLSASTVTAGEDLGRGTTTSTSVDSKWLLGAVARFEENGGEVLELVWSVDTRGEPIREVIHMGDTKSGRAALKIGEDRIVDQRPGDWLVEWLGHETDEAGRVELLMYGVGVSNSQSGATGEESAEAEDYLVAANGLELGKVSQVGYPVDSMVDGREALVLLEGEDGKLFEGMVPVLSAIAPGPACGTARIRPTTWEEWEKAQSALEKGRQ